VDQVPQFCGSPARRVFRIFIRREQEWCRCYHIVDFVIQYHDYILTANAPFVTILIVIFIFIAIIIIIIIIFIVIIFTIIVTTNENSI
jgi:hypothetical protein